MHSTARIFGRDTYFDLFDLAPVGYMTLTESDRIIEANLMAANLFGLSQKALSGHCFTPLVLHQSQGVWQSRQKRVFETGEPQVFDIRLLGTDGKIFWGHISMTLDDTVEGEANSRVVLVDVSAYKQLEADLALEKKFMKITLESIGDGVISADSTGHIVLMNRVAENMTGWTQENAYGKPIREIFQTINETTREISEDIIAQVLIGKLRPRSNHIILIAKGGLEFPIEDFAVPILGDDGEVVGVVLEFRDFTDRKKKLEEIRYLSYHDHLTGLYNRRFFEEELLRLDTARNLPLTIVMGDVNGLKLINDSFGHAMGDELLRKVAEALNLGCRADEIVARLGGDEFVILLPKTDSAAAEKIIRRIRDITAKCKVGSIDISITFGFETKIRADENIQDIFKNTENHMYRKKITESSSIRSKTIRVIMDSLFEKNPREMMHSERVGTVSAAIATGLNLSEEEVSKIRIAGLMHDIGKIGIDETILNKPSKLDEVEWNEMQRHSEIGYRILSSVNEFSEIADYILEHHERWNGTGYPKGLRQENISLQARIITLADAYDAMTGTRPYGKPHTIMEAVQEIIRCAGTQFDPSIARIFVENVLGMSWDSDKLEIQ